MAINTLRAAAGSRLALFGRWPIATRHVEPSLIASPSGGPSARLLDVALQAVAGARLVDLEWLAARDRSAFINIWPGEHYKLLVALVTLLRPQTVVEIGTATGASALAMKSALSEDAKLVTFDIVPWQAVPQTVLREEDFTDGRLEQRLEDLSTPTGWRANAELLRGAELIFLDALHDGEQERNFLRGFEEVGLAAAPILVLDDIRLWRMLSFWEGIERPKLDLTSFGHWSGTGLVDFA
ncbi:MAG TPA: class I SAM-dependent methyltransferase [Solirubrobacteraceae bacterium]|nr:class I SAM-dependent methyltransferase [Solirubrobacteraceae bacterium]